jgi:hypothetical protein
MSMSTPESKNIEMLSQLYDALVDGPQDTLAIQKSLEAQGVDVQAAISKGLHLFASYSKRRRLELAREKFERLRQLMATWSVSTGGSVDYLRDRVARVLAGGGGAAYQAYYRKLERFSESDLQSLVEDASLLEFIVREGSESE